MKSNKIHGMNTIIFTSMLVDKIKILAITCAIAFTIIPDLFSQNYYVSPNASGSGNGTISNPWTIYQAAANAQAGDVVFIDKGTYALDAVLSFKNSGNATNPIIFRGVRVNEDEKTADGTNNTFLRQDNSTTGGQISISGSYVILENMIIRQQYPKYLVTIGGNHVTLDSVVTQYPSNLSSGSNHTIVTSADYTTLRYCYFWQGPRTIVWVKPSYPNTCDNFLMEYTTISGFDNHYAIQLMPQTLSTPVPKVTNATIRNCTFTNGGYESSLYLRNVYNCRIYNNLFINSMGRYADCQLAYTDGSSSEPGYDAHSIFANNTTYSTMVGGSGVKTASSILFMGESNQDGWTVKNNVSSVADGLNVYRYFCYSSSPSGQNFSADYNLIYIWNKSVNSISSSWTDVNSCATSSYSWTDWKSQRGFDTHSIIDTNPNFVNPTTDPATWDFRLGSNRTGEDLSSWGITTDYDGNPRDPNNPTIGAFEYVTGGVDVTLPNLVGAVLNNTTSLRLSFSEQLNSATAQNISNYSINNGITITGASVSGSQVTLTTSAHSAGNYVVTVNNVTDLAGNIINPNQNTAAYNYTQGDVTPPNLVGAVLNNPTSLTLNFSEQLNSSTAQSINNYTINNGITITGASVSGSQVTLTTSAHSPGNYVVTVNNVTDLAGNVINPSNNSAAYNYSIVDVTPPQVVSAAIIDSVKLNVYFSENLDPNTSQNINNYNIAGISITSVVLNSNIVTLSTSVHSNGTYTVIVSNVKDLAGNIIDPQQNSAIYEYVPPVPGQMKLPISSVLESVVPEPQHNGEKTIDGNGFYQGDPDSRWSGDTMPEWLVYDLGDVKIINQSKLSFYNWNSGRIYNYSLQVSSDSIQWSNVRTNIPSALEEWSIEEIGPIEARFIKVIFVANNQNAWAGLWESEFWGHLKIPTDIEDEEITPTSFVLEQNYPNPFNPSTMIRFSLPSASNVRLTVYNTLGELIMTLAEGDYEAGSYNIEFSASGISSGIYFYRIEAGNFAETKKMIVMK